jgi:hypothetical protein
MIEIPPRLAKRPLDSRGYPIPVTTARIDGRWDFRVTDPKEWSRVIKTKRCALRGEKPDKSIWFVGVPLCHENRLCYDPGMHEKVRPLHTVDIDRVSASR